MAKSNPTTIGSVYGRLTVIGFAGSKKNQRCWNCRCVCGVEIVASSAKLRAGKKLSCGCLQRESITKHMACGTALYHCWEAMNQRCYNSNNPGFPGYGGRGIKVCDRWRNSFVSFADDVGPRPTPKHSIDRWPSNDGNYEPGNVRWATNREQLLNRRNNIRLTCDETTLLLTEWVERTGIPWCTIYARIQRGWDATKALKTPVQMHRKSR